MAGLLFHGFLILSTTTILSAGYDKYKIVERGNDVYLECIGTKGLSCMWTKVDPDGSSSVVIDSGGVITTERYTLIDNPSLGDCSIKITNTTFEDSGVLTCAIFPADSTVVWKLDIGKSPEYPQVYYNGTKIYDGNFIYVNPEYEREVELQCIVANGNPAANVTWTYYINRNDSSYFNETWDYSYYTKNEIVTIESNGELKTVTNTLTIGKNPHDRDKEIILTCLAQHPLYVFPNESRITFTINILDHSNAVKHVEVSGPYFSEELNSIVGVCKADGIPPVEYLWFIRRLGNDNWELLNDSINPNQTLDKEGSYLCEARNKDNRGIYVKSTNLLNITNEDIIQNTTQVEAKMYWDIPTIGDTASCEANGKLPINYRWYHKKHLDINWKKVGYEKTIILKVIGFYYCEAKSTDDWVRSSNRIFIRRY